MHEVKRQVPAYERKQEKARAGGGARFGTAPSRLHAGDRVPTTMRAQETRSNANMAARRAAQLERPSAVTLGNHAVRLSPGSSVFFFALLFSFRGRILFADGREGFKVEGMFLVFQTPGRYAEYRKTVER